MLMILNTHPHIWDACIHTERAEKHLSRLQLTLMTNFLSLKMQSCVNFYFLKLEETHICIAEIMFLIIAKMEGNWI